MDGKSKPVKHRTEYRNLGALRSCRDRRSAADLRYVDRTAQHRLDRPRTTDIDNLRFDAVFLEQLQIMGNPERRIGIGESAERQANLLQLCRFKS